LSSSTRLFN